MSLRRRGFRGIGPFAAAGMILLGNKKSRRLAGKDKPDDRPRCELDDEILTMHSGGYWYCEKCGWKPSEKSKKRN